MHDALISYFILMFQLFVSLCLLVLFKDIAVVVDWDPSNFTFNPGDTYELVWHDEFENSWGTNYIIEIFEKFPNTQRTLIQ